VNGMQMPAHANCVHLGIILCSTSIDYNGFQHSLKI